MKNIQNKEYYLDDENEDSRDGKVYYFLCLYVRVCRIRCIWNTMKINYLGEQISMYFSKLEVNLDHGNRYLWVCPDGMIFLHNFSPPTSKLMIFLSPC